MSIHGPTLDTSKKSHAYIKQKIVDIDSEFWNIYMQEGRNIEFMKLSQASCELNRNEEIKDSQ